MLNLAFTNQYLENLYENREDKVLIVCEKIDEQSLLIEKCLDAGVLEDNIFNHNSIFNIKEALNGEISHIIINARLYNYFVFSVLDKFVAEKRLSILIYHGDDEHKTIRLITDERLLHINKNTTALLLRKLLDE